MTDGMGKTRCPWKHCGTSLNLLWLSFLQSPILIFSFLVKSFSFSFLFSSSYFFFSSGVYCAEGFYLARHMMKWQHHLSVKCMNISSIMPTVSSRTHFAFHVPVLVSSSVLSKQSTKHKRQPGWWARNTSRNWEKFGEMLVVSWPAHLVCFVRSSRDFRNEL